MPDVPSDNTRRLLRRMRALEEEYGVRGDGVPEGVARAVRALQRVRENSQRVAYHTFYGHAQGQEADTVSRATDGRGETQAGGLSTSHENKGIIRWV